MNHKKLKILAILLISYNTFNPIIVNADELIGSKTTEIVDTPEVNEDTTEANEEVVDTTEANKEAVDATETTEKHYATGVGKSNPTDIVIIPDASLRENISKQLGKSPTDDITVADMERLTDFSLTKKLPQPVSDLTGMEYAVNIMTLEIQNQDIYDITPLENLTNLSYLQLSNTDIVDISVLSGLINLEILYLPYNQISVISALSGLTNLTHLYLGSNQISDISSLSGLTNLTHLYLGSNQISDISSLSGLINLNTLYLESNQISDISALSGLTKLTDINFANNQISDISPLPSSVSSFGLIASEQTIELQGEYTVEEYENLEFNAIDYDGTKIPIDLGTPDLNGGTKEVDWTSTVNPFFMEHLNLHIQ